MMKHSFVNSSENDSKVLYVKDTISNPSIEGKSDMVQARLGKDEWGMTSLFDLQNQAVSQ